MTDQPLRINTTLQSWVTSIYSKAIRIGRGEGLGEDVAAVHESLPELAAEIVERYNAHTGLKTEIDRLKRVISRLHEHLSRAHNELVEAGENYNREAKIRSLQRTIDGLHVRLEKYLDHWKKYSDEREDLKAISNWQTLRIRLLEAENKSLKDQVDPARYIGGPA